jgi:hypothetical protein
MLENCLENGPAERKAGIFLKAAKDQLKCFDIPAK